MISLEHELPTQTPPPSGDTIDITLRYCLDVHSRVKSEYISPDLHWADGPEMLSMDVIRKKPWIYLSMQIH